VPVDDDAYVSPANLGPGQLVLDNGNTSGKATFSNVNKYLSLRGDVILAPRELIEEDYPNVSFVTKP
jgi:H2-forming N5,N10-methylenetetrahydromethanopterin dehydrogenase-like enzyme